VTAQPTPPELDAHRHRKDWRDIAERWPDQAWSSEAVLALLDALTRAEARADIRGRAVVIYRDRARKAEAWAEYQNEEVDLLEVSLDRAEARIKAVEDVLDKADADKAASGWKGSSVVRTAVVRRALEGERA